MNLKELHPRTNLISSVSFFHCREGEITALQILGNQQLNIHALEIPALLICLAGELVIKTEKGTEEILMQSDYHKMDPKIGHKLTALENCNLLLIR